MRCEFPIHKIRIDAQPRRNRLGPTKKKKADGKEVKTTLFVTAEGKTGQMRKAMEGGGRKSKGEKNEESQRSEHQNKVPLSLFGGIRNRQGGIRYLATKTWY